MWMAFLKAFLVGGALCVVAQLLLDYTSITSARILVIFVLAGVVLSFFGLYQPLVDYAGAGASVPLLGSGHALARGVKQGVEDHGFLGIFMGGITGTAGGITAAIVFGYLASLMFTAKTKE